MVFSRAGGQHWPGILVRLGRACLTTQPVPARRSGGGLRGQTTHCSLDPKRSEGEMLNFGPNPHKKTSSESTGVSGCLDAKSGWVDNPHPTWNPGRVISLSQRTPASHPTPPFCPGWRDTQPPPQPAEPSNRVAGLLP